MMTCQEPGCARPAIYRHAIVRRGTAAAVEVATCTTHTAKRKRTAQARITQTAALVCPHCSYQPPSAFALRFHLSRVHGIRGTRAHKKAAIGFSATERDRLAALRARLVTRRGDFDSSGAIEMLVYAGFGRRRAS
jgi:hypothetical protein